MSFDNLVSAAQQYFPSLQIKYKNQDSFMKFLGTLLFFTPGFMTTYTTTIGDTTYFPSTTFVQQQQVSSAVILMHELVHMYDEKRLTKVLFGFLYLFPQILAVICLPLIFLVSWKIFLPLFILFALPLPAYFRMYFEKRAYLASLYVLQALGTRLHFSPTLKTQETFFVSQFGGSYYYFMWPFSNIQSDFDQAVVAIKAGQRPYQDLVFDMLDVLITKV
jgi:hypothetical protein